MPHAAVFYHAYATTLYEQYTYEISQPGNTADGVIRNSQGCVQKFVWCFEV